MIFAFTNHQLALKFEFEESDFDAGLANEGACIPKVLREGLGGGVGGGFLIEGVLKASNLRGKGKGRRKK